MTSIDGVRPWVLPGTIARLISSLTTLIMIFFFNLQAAKDGTAENGANKTNGNTDKIPEEK